jgi:mannose-6-phosphate isomerase-like protein (cupin superfamily)
MVLKFSGLFVLAVVVSSAQDTVPEGFQHWTSASLRQIGQELRTEAAPAPHHVAGRRLADFPNELFMLSHREADGVVEWHETQADIFFIQSGSATLVVGGTMVGGETVEPHERRNGKIQGGVQKQLSPGDVVRIPPKVPHQILLEGSKEFTYFVVKVKGY